MGNSVYRLNYQLLRSTKYRRHVLIPPINTRVSRMITNLCNDNNFGIIRLEGMSDNGHLLVIAKQTDSPSNSMKTIHGVAAYCIFCEFPAIKRKLCGGHLWNPRYCVGTSGEVTAETNDIVRIKK